MDKRKLALSVDKDTKDSLKNEPSPSNLYSVSPVPPKGGKMSKKNYDGGGRKIKNDAVKVSRQEKQLHPSDILRLSEKCNSEIEHIKSSFVNASTFVIEDSKQELEKLHRQYNIIAPMVATKEKIYEKLLANLNHLTHIESTNKDQEEVVDGTMSSVSSEIDQVLENLAAEQRTAKVLKKMITYLVDEVLCLKSEITDVKFQVDASRYEMGALASSHSITNQYHKHKVSELKDMKKTISGFETSYDHRAAVMERILATHPILHLSDTPREATLPLPFDGSLSWNSASDAGLAVPSRGQPSAAASRASSLFSKDRERTVEADSWKGLSSEEMLEVRERFDTVTSRLQELREAQGQINSAITFQSSLKLGLLDNTKQVAYRQQQLSSGRKIYQHVEMVDSILAKAKSDAAKSLEKKTSVVAGIAALRRELPRVLSKITKSPAVDLQVEQIPETVNQLIEEINTFVKSIETALLKEASPDELKEYEDSMNQGLVNRTSRSSGIEHLHSHPSFNKLNALLFHNLITARPDISNDNVRVMPREKHNLHMQKKFPQDDDHDNDTAKASVNNLMMLNHTDLLNETPLDRATVREISKLIIEQQHQQKPKNAIRSKYDPRKQPTIISYHTDPDGDEEDDAVGVDA